jgi:hypothetical protein
MSYKWQELLTLREHPSSPPVFFGGVRVAHLFKLWPFKSSDKSRMRKAHIIP